MLNKILKIVITVTPAFMAGVAFSGAATSSANAEDKQVKPNIHLLTNEKTALKVNDSIPSPSERSTERSNERSSEHNPVGALRKHSLGIGIGQTFLRSDLATNGNDKITGDLYYNYSASYSFDFVANAHYSKHSFLNREATISGLALAIKGKGFQFDAFSPFVLGGFGFYLPSVRRIENGIPTDTRTQLVFGVNVGAGVELKLNDEVTIGVIAHYHDPFDVRQDTGGKLEASYMKLLIVASYTFN